MGPDTTHCRENRCTREETGKSYTSEFHHITLFKMADEKEKIKIPKLTNNNYAAWAFRIRSLLDSKDLLEVLTVSAPEVDTNREVEVIATQSAQLAEWKINLAQEGATSEKEASAFMSHDSKWFQSSFNNSKCRTKWIIDSGATWHMCKDKVMFSELDENYITYVTTANGTKLKAPGRGKVPLVVETQHGSWKVELNNVLYAPMVSENLISVNQLARK